MKHIILLLSLMSFLFAEPAWLNARQKIQGHKSAVGMAEAYFPAHVQEKVALMRAKAKLFPEEALQDQENNQSQLHEKNKLKIKDRYKDKEGNLYLLVIAL